MHDARREVTLHDVIGAASPHKSRLADAPRSATIRGAGTRSAALAFAFAFGLGSAACGPRDKSPDGGESLGADAGPGPGGSAGQAGSTGESSDSFLRGHGSPGAEPGTWTYLVYMIADNDLESFALAGLDELMGVGTGAGLTILAQVDRADGETDEAIGGIAPFTGAKRVRVDPGALSELADLGEVDSGSGATFAEFLSWGIQTAPADHYALVLWDHGGAWGRFGADASDQNDGLDSNELTRALDVTIAANALKGPIDLLSFDACLLGTWEVAAGLQGRARYLLASEDLEPGHGLDYQPLALAKTGAEPAAIGSALIDAYAAKARAHGTFARITLALTDLNRLGAVNDGVSRIARALSDHGFERSRAAAIGRSRAAVSVFGSVPHGVSSSMIDLRLWSNALAAQVPDLLPDVQALGAALDQAVVGRVTGDVHSSAGGLSIYFPIVDDLYDRRYDELALVGDWRRFVTAFHEAGRALDTRPTFVSPSDRAAVSRVDGRFVVSGALVPDGVDSIVSSTLAFGLLGADGTGFILGEKPATLAAGGVVTADFDGRALRLSQGGLTDYAAYVFEPGSSDVSTLSIPLEYTDDDEVTTLVLVVAVDASGGVLSQRYYQPLDGAWAERTPAPGSTLAVLMPTLAPDASEVEEVAQSATFDGLAPLDIQSVSLGAGTPVFVRLRATDYAGNSDTLEGSDTL
jgi:hypothetical protein